MAADVCRVLEMKPNGGSYANSLRALDRKEITHTKDVGVKLSGIGQSNILLVSESGLYKLIMRSNKPQAKACINALQGII